MDGWSRALCLANSRVVLLLGRKERLIEKKEERKDSPCQICPSMQGTRKDGDEESVSRTARKFQISRREEKWQCCWCCQDQQRASRMAQGSAEKLAHTGPAK